MSTRVTPVIAALVVALAFAVAAASGPAFAARRATVFMRVHYRPPTLSHCPHGMSSTAGAHFVVWACDEAHAAAEERKALSVAEGFYGPTTALMGRPLANRGPTGDGKLTARTDLYLIYGNQTLTREDDSDELTPVIANCANVSGTEAVTTADPATLQGPGASKSSGYIAISRNLLERCPVMFGSALVHEYFHVLSLRYNITTSCDQFWFDEASAVWAEWYFDPVAAPQSVYPEFKRFQNSPGRTLTDTTESQNAYADFIWPMFMQQRKGAESIVAAWRAMQGKKGCVALTGAVNSILPFASAFDEFAVENFDTELQNLSTFKMGWPAGFGPTYQELKPRAGAAPKFPQLQPKTRTVVMYAPLSGSSWHTTTKVSLAPLSAHYDDVGVLDPAESAEFDFSGLSNRRDLGITLIAADLGVNGSYTTVRVKGDVAKICFAADNAVDGTGKTTAGGAVYVILDNHSRGPAAKVTGSYKVTARTACAASVSGTITVDTKSVDSNGSTTQTATLHMTLTPNPRGEWDVAPSSTYSATYDRITTGSCPGTEHGQGNGTVKSWPDADIELQAYEYPYADPAQIGVPMLRSATTTGTYSNCAGSGTQTVFLEMSPSCPPPRGTGQAVQYGLLARYTAGKAALDFGCSDQYSSAGATTTTTITGTLTATDPIPCGLWTPGCSIAAARTAGSA